MFEYFISLGSNCPTAASMAKQGLRAFSGPFDWLITKNLEYVLHFIENDFDKFLLYENLAKYAHPNIPTAFFDKSCNFIGNVDNNGIVKDLSNRYVGCVNPDGSVLNEKGEFKLI